MICDDAGVLIICSRFYIVMSISIHLGLVVLIDILKTMYCDTSTMYRPRYLHIVEFLQAREQLRRLLFALYLY